MNTVEDRFSDSFRAHIDKQPHGYISNLADQVGLSQSYISNLASGRRSGSETNRRKIAEHIGLSYDQMIGLKNSKRNLSKKSDSLPKDDFPATGNELNQKKGGSMTDAEKDLIQILKDQVAGLKSDKDTLKDYLDDLRVTVRNQEKELGELRSENKELRKALGEAQRRLKELMEQHAQSPEDKKKPAANQ